MRLESFYPIVATDQLKACRDFYRRWFLMEVVFEATWFVLLSGGNGATAHPSLQGLRRWLLATRDAHNLYSQFGFTPLAAPSRFMELHSPNVYALSDLQQAP